GVPPICAFSPAVYSKGHTAQAIRLLRSYPRNLRPPKFRILFQVPYPLDCFLSHSSKNCRRIPTIFPMWNSPNLCVLCVSTLSFSRRGASAPLAASSGPPVPRPYSLDNKSTYPRQINLHPCQRP